MWLDFGIIFWHIFMWPYFGTYSCAKLCVIQNKAELCGLILASYSGTYSCGHILAHIHVQNYVWFRIKLNYVAWFWPHILAHIHVAIFIGTYFCAKRCVIQNKVELCGLILASCSGTYSCAKLCVISCNFVTSLLVFYDNFILFWDIFN